MIRNFLALLLAGCGKQGELMRRPPPGQAAAIDPTKPLPSQLLAPPTQDGQPAVRFIVHAVA